MTYNKDYCRILVIEPTEEHKTYITYELLACAAAFKVLRQINKYKEENGEEVTHGTVKELLDAFIDATIIDFKVIELSGKDNAD
ncbi:hypothetical protein BJ944DRAFT_240097 [Cunninghamella echinulata]|nr:hypothetical protein BJ944DRAFT_240097 [Cunninghamella echinulata]